MWTKCILISFLVILLEPFAGELADILDLRHVVVHCSRLWALAGVCFLLLLGFPQYLRPTKPPLVKLVVYLIFGSVPLVYFFNEFIPSFWESRAETDVIGILSMLPLLYCYFGTRGDISFAFNWVAIYFLPQIPCGWYHCPLALLVAICFRHSVVNAETHLSRWFKKNPIPLSGICCALLWLYSGYFTWPLAVSTLQSFIYSRAIEHQICVVISVCVAVNIPGRRQRVDWVVVLLASQWYPQLLMSTNVVEQLATAFGSATLAILHRNVGWKIKIQIRPRFWKFFLSWGPPLQSRLWYSKRRCRSNFQSMKTKVFALVTIELFSLTTFRRRVLFRRSRPNHFRRHTEIPRKLRRYLELLRQGKLQATLAALHRSIDEKLGSEVDIPLMDVPPAPEVRTFVRSNESVGAKGTAKSRKKGRPRGRGRATKRGSEVGTPMLNETLGVDTSTPDRLSFRWKRNVGGGKQRKQSKISRSAVKVQKTKSKPVLHSIGTKLARQMDAIYLRGEEDILQCAAVEAEIKRLRDRIHAEAQQVEADKEAFLNAQIQSLIAQTQQIEADKEASLIAEIQSLLGQTQQIMDTASATLLADMDILNQQAEESLDSAVKRMDKQVAKLRQMANKRAKAAANKRAKAAKRKSNSVIKRKARELETIEKQIKALERNDLMFQHSDFDVLHDKQIPSPEQLQGFDTSPSISKALLLFWENSGRGNFQSSRHLQELEAIMKDPASMDAEKLEAQVAIAELAAEISKCKVVDEDTANCVKAFQSVVNNEASFEACSCCGERQFTQKTKMFPLSKLQKY